MHCGCTAGARGVVGVGHARGAVGRRELCAVGLGMHKAIVGQGRARAYSLANSCTANVNVHEAHGQGGHTGAEAASPPELRGSGSWDPGGQVCDVRYCVCAYSASVHTGLTAPSADNPNSDLLYSCL